MPLSRLVMVARGREPADVVLRNARLVNVLTGEIEDADVAFCGSRIAAAGRGYSGTEIVDLRGAYACPGFIDAHVHIESAMVPPREFAALVLPRGVTTAITDPHEIANVLGLEGIRAMLEEARSAPMSLFANASSCVPATDLATSGARLGADELRELLREDGVLGLAEVMNYPGVLAGDAEVLRKIEAFAGRPIDGHCPGLAGADLDAYAAVGIRSDHECTTAAEALAKVRAGLVVLVREGSVARDLAALLPAVSPANERRFCLCTDDRQIPDLLEHGSIDHLVRRAIETGLDPVTAIRMATLNPAEHFGLHDRGAIAPGRRADVVVFRDLRRPEVEAVWVAGRAVARDGQPLWERAPMARPIANSVHVDWGRVAFRLPATGRRIRAIGAVPDRLLTESLVLDATVVEGEVRADPARDLLKLAVVERHGRNGNVGLSFVRGLGLRRGAIAGTVAHDHHNLIVAGADDRSMLAAARAVAAAGGGLAAASGETVLATLPLPIAGLMSPEPHAAVAQGLRRVVAAARELGSPLHDPFMTLSFLGLEVIPSLKLTDRGLVDVERMALVSPFAEGA